MTEKNDIINQLNNIDNNCFINNQNELIHYLKDDLKPMIINYSSNFTNNKISKIITIINKLHFFDLPNICQSNIFSFLKFNNILFIKIISKQFNLISNYSTSISNLNSSHIINSTLISNLKLFNSINTLYYNKFPNKKFYLKKIFNKLKYIYIYKHNESNNNLSYYYIPNIMPNIQYIYGLKNDWNIDNNYIHNHLKILYISNFITMHWNFKKLYILKLYGNKNIYKNEIELNNFYNNIKNKIFKLKYFSHKIQQSLYSSILLYLNKNNLLYIEINSDFYKGLNIILNNNNKNNNNNNNNSVSLPNLIGLKLIIDNENNLNNININTINLKLLILKYQFNGKQNNNNLIKFLKKLNFKQLNVIKFQYNMLQNIGLNLLLNDDFYNLLSNKFCFVCENLDYSHDIDIDSIFNKIYEKLKIKKKKKKIYFYINDEYNFFTKVIKSESLAKDIIDIYDEYKIFYYFLNDINIDKLCIY